MSLRAHLVPHTVKLEQRFSGKSKVGCSQGGLLLSTVRESLLSAGGSLLSSVSLEWSMHCCDLHLHSPMMLSVCASVCLCPNVGFVSGTVVLD